MTDWLASRAAFLLAFVVLLAISFAGGWHTQTWRYGAMEKDRVQTQLESERAYSARSRTRFHADGGQHSAVMADSIPHDRGQRSALMADTIPR